MAKAKVRLTLQDWLKAGLELLGSEGEKALTIEGLCQATQRTKGSFYHHFKSHEVFVSALLDYWQSEYTARIFKEVEQLSDPSERRRELDRLAASLDNRVERSIRRWAGVDARVNAVLTQIDEERISYLMALIVELGQSNEAVAYELAVIEYAYFVGIQQLFPEAEPLWLEQLSIRLTHLISSAA